MNLPWDTGTQADWRPGVERGAYRLKAESVLTLREHELLSSAASPASQRPGTTT